MKLSNKIAIVTGGGTGIGKAIASKFIEEDATVIIVGRRKEKILQTAEELGNRAVGIQCDVTDEKQVKELFSNTFKTYKKIDFLINNAGRAANFPSHEMSLEMWRKVIDVNLTAVFLCSREFIKVMMPLKEGRIINIGSISAQMSRPNNAPYTASKFGLEGLTRAMALEMRAHGISVSVVHPGNVATDIWKGREEISESEGLIPLEDIASAVLTMVDLSKNVNILNSTILPITQPYLGRG